MTVKDMYDGFMKPRRKDLVERPPRQRAHRLLHAAGFVDTINLPSVNGGALFFSTGADPTNGTVYVESKDMPSIVKLVPGGRIHSPPMPAD